ncbi:MAG TPA: hypothetical protein VFT16_03225 [Candidatus Saccharimonadales bacterium]|nr:hypothetical protein [Candidatus Saccharimonadales bacterium]
MSLPDSYPVGPFFDERFQATLDFEQGPDRGYGFVEGDYSEDELFKNPESPTVRQVGDVVLRGVEAHLAGYLEALLNQQDGEPIVGLDVGAGLGLTWLRLAKAFKPRVEAGDLVLATTNAHGRDQFLMRTTSDIFDEYHTLSSEIGCYVATINTPFRNISSQSVPIGSGKRLPLLGNTSLVHEQRSLTQWGMLPEVEIVGVGSLLSQDGIGLFRASSGQRLRDPYFGPTNDANSGKWKGVDIAYTVLQESLGLRQTGTLDRDGVALPLDYRLSYGPLARINDLV